MAYHDIPRLRDSRNINMGSCPLEVRLHSLPVYTPSRVSGAAVEHCSLSFRYVARDEPDILFYAVFGGSMKLHLRGWLRKFRWESHECNVDRSSHTIPN